jgi:hypothetical protein
VRTAAEISTVNAGCKLGKLGYFADRFMNLYPAHLINPPGMTPLENLVLDKIFSSYR